MKAEDFRSKKCTLADMKDFVTVAINFMNHYLVTSLYLHDDGKIACYDFPNIYYNHYCEITKDFSKVYDYFIEEKMTQFNVLEVEIFENMISEKIVKISLRINFKDKIIEEREKRKKILTTEIEREISKNIKFSNKVAGNIFITNASSTFPILFDILSENGYRWKVSEDLSTLTIIA